MVLLHSFHPILSCNYPSLPTNQARIQRTNFPFRAILPNLQKSPVLSRRELHIRRDSSESSGSETNVEESEDGMRVDSNGGDSTIWSDWITSGLVFGIWAGLIYYVFELAPNQTPYRDMYFLEKLLNLRGDDGFKMNEVLVSLWYIMGLWPLIYSMLLLPTGRSSKSKIPVWPFVLLSFIGGAYALIPYFVVWKPPPPPIEEDEITKLPLNFLESRITAVITLVAGLGLIGYAALAGGDSWKEFYQYSRESKFIHATCIDFCLLSTFAPFWVYNDITARRWSNKGSWLVPVALVPFVGPALYILLRPSLSSLLTRSESVSEET